MNDDAAVAPPAGFLRHDRVSGLTAPWEPLYSHRMDDGVTRLGFFAREAHCNSRGFVHGGLVSALADNAMGESGARTSGARGLVTVYLSVDFLASAQLGEWVEVRPRVLKAGRTLCFIEAHVIAEALRDAGDPEGMGPRSPQSPNGAVAGERIIARASATFAVPRSA